MIKKLQIRMIEYLEVASTAFLNPEDLSVYLKDRKSGIFYGILSVFFSGFSAAVAFYILRDYYNDIFYFELLFMVLITTGYGLGVSFIIGSLIDAVIQIRKPGKEGQSRQSVLIAMVSLLPGIFVYPAVVIVNLVAFTTILLIPLSLAVFAWQVSILYRAARYLYEINRREMVIAIAWAVGVTASFPLVATIFLVMQTGAFLS